MSKLVICEFLDEDALAEVSATIDLNYDPSLVRDIAALKTAIRDADALIVRSATRVTADLLDAAPNLKVLGRLGVGLDNVDVDACAMRGVAVCNSPGANAVSVGEYTVVMALTLLRGAYRCNDAMLAGGWPRADLIGREAEGLRLGIIGLGATGQASARRALGMGMRIAAVDPYLADDDPAWDLAEQMTLPDLLAWADALTLHVPLTEETRHMIDAAALSAMGSDSVLINAARGGVIDEAAVAEALRAGMLAGAAIDVFETEPLSAGTGAKFAGLSNLILTPHIAGVTGASNSRVSRITVRNVLEALATG